jgi:hypothetical protein
VAICAVVTGDTVAVNATLLAPAATVTDAGTVTAELLLARFTPNPPAGAGAVSVTAQASVADPVTDAALQLIVPSAAGTTPVPLRLIAAEPAEVLSVSVTAPVMAPAAAGSNCTVIVAVWPGCNVTGVLMPASVKPVPLIAAALMVSAAVPDEVSVTVPVVAVFTVTSPKLTLLLLSVRPGVAAPSCRAYVSLKLPDCAVNVAVCAAVTAFTVAVNTALVAPAATVTDPGTTTAALLLFRLTASPSVPAGAVSFTVHSSASAPVIASLLHVTALSTPAADCPVPLSAIAAVPAEVFVVSFTVPLADPFAVGSNLMLRLAVFPGSSVTG